ncbi:MAG: hypothetical protein KDI67_09155, partial [Gammaproteobacteria bacterium]|nr:hypothetical protein [Gammaproteobacteria bacterium]
MRTCPDNLQTRQNKTGGNPTIAPNQLIIILIFIHGSHLALQVGPKAIHIKNGAQAMNATSRSRFFNATIGFFLSGSVAQAAPVFINEIHYDNTGGDTGEAIEIAGPAGTNLSGASLVLYNGSGGAPYDTISLSG